MVDDNVKKTILKKILQSKGFRESNLYQNLLSYLVNANLSAAVPKEITIAIEVFGKDSSFNSYKDATVRYHIHVLRKKLDEYYKDEGRQDKIRISIPKGHYEVKFISDHDQNKLFFKKSLAYVKRWQTLVILSLLLITIYLAYQYLKLRGASGEAYSWAERDPIWSTFFENGYPTLLVIGDDFLLDEYRADMNRYRQIRDWKIDSENDLREFLILHPRENIWKSEITGIPFKGADNILDVLPIIYRFREEVGLKMSSELILDEVKMHNIIYIGELKNLRVLKQILYRTPIRFQYKPDERLFIVRDETDTLQTFVRIEAPYEQKNKFNIDYSVFLKMPGFENENFMFIVGFGYGGRLERTKMLGNPKLLAELEDHIEKINKVVPKYFMVIFEVKSIERTGFTNEIKYFKELSADFF
ncbi:MAG: hypothetical protein ONB44_03160 [candidate division KSB1 bacterium]|nr:hypothetical protein [candidate division KSB1 bacterium]MDZ7301126.1 hypothetical protein [candidate division KSB1 bacterium]MDZ7311990.1 hypothetical protein [candidate division KSB1 bacterium]